MYEIVEIAKAELTSLRRFNKIVGIIVSIIMPIFEGVWIGFSNKITAADNSVFWVVLVVFGSFHAILAIIHIGGTQLTQEIYFKAREIFEENEKLQKDKNSLDSKIAELSFLEAYVRGWRALQRKFVESKIENSDDFQNAIEDILSTLVDSRDKLFYFSANEKWNFALYIYDQQDRKLKPVWRKKHHQHPSDGPGREWAPGQGHIGKAFSDGEPKITPDSNDSVVRNLMGPPAHIQKPYDSEIYRSYASIPLGPINVGEDPIGVLVATSDQVARFDSSNSLILRHAAAVLTNFIYLNGIQRDTIFSQNN